MQHAIVAPQGKCALPVGSAPPENDIATSRIVADALAQKKVVVLGLGFVQIRKGVDVFASVAREVARLIGPENILFLWVGEGYAPDHDVHISVWIRDQVKESGMADVVRITGQVGPGHLERLYTSAHAVMLSSRLDSFPNVAIDAMHAGLPAGSFEGASGVAEAVAQLEQADQLVAPYLDATAQPDGPR